LFILVIVLQFVLAQRSHTLTLFCMVCRGYVIPYLPIQHRYNSVTLKKEAAFSRKMLLLSASHLTQCQNPED